MVFLWFFLVEEKIWMIEFLRILGGGFGKGFFVVLCWVLFNISEFIYID